MGNPADSPTAPAQPAPYIYDVLAACRDSGRTAAIVTTTPVPEVRAYLEGHDLSTQITFVAASIVEVTSTLEASPTDCAAIASSPTGIEAAQAAGITAIAYARTPSTWSMPEQLRLSTAWRT